MEVYIFMVALSTIKHHWLDEVPSITISASYLEQFGFVTGQKVVIEISHGIITIRPVDCEDDT